MGKPLPQVIVDARKQALRIWLPGPPQVISQLAQAIDTPGQIKMIGNTSMKLSHSGAMIPAFVRFGIF